MVLEKENFYPTRLEEERESGKWVNLRLNDEEYEWLQALKMFHNDKKSASVIKKEAFKQFILDKKLREKRHRK